MSSVPFKDESRVSEYERSLLGQYLMGAPINDSINEQVFLTKGHKVIFPIIQELKTRGLDLNIMVLVTELEKRGKLEEAGGAACIAQITNSNSSIANVSYYEMEVLTAHRERCLWQVGVELQEAVKSNLAPDSLIEDTVKKLSGITAVGPQKPTGILFSDLLKKQFPPDSWHIENIVGSGLTVLTGASKIGKSWTALQLVTALDQGGCFMGTLKANKCDTLYLALEDTPKRIQRRLLKQGNSVIFNGSRLETNRWTVATLRTFLKVNPQFRVVIIDTLQKMMGLNDLNDYSQTVNGLSALKAIADDLDIAIIVVHHNRKGSTEDGDHMESALGSTGINATADCTLTMRRKRGTGEATLSVTGRDVEDASYTLSWDRDLCSWSISGQGSLKPALTEAQQQIIDLLESEAKNWTTAEIAEITGIKKYEVSRQAKELADKGFIQKPFYGQWSAKEGQKQFAGLHSPREMQTCKLENEQIF